MTNIISTRQAGYKLTKVQFQAVKGLVIDGLNSKHSKAMYGKAIDDFLTWREENSGGIFAKSQVQSYKAYLLEETDYAPSTINLRLSAIRKLASEGR
jgi:hypothetical protein